MLLAGYVILFCCIWLVAYGYLMWTLKHLPRFHEQVTNMSPPSQWPSLSIIIPACNEAEHIESALSSLATQDYPELEIFVINDRSTDATGDIINRLAAQNAHIKPIHISSLPDGWLGKVHALHQGMIQARGEWILFTDADVHFAPGAIRRAITYAQHTKADHLALLPRVLLDSFWLDVAVRSFGLLFLLTTRAAQVHQRNNKYYIGVGAFNLVKREIFDRTPGFEWLRLEPGDDAALGMMVKQAGGQIRFAMADNDLAVSWYPNVRAMFKGLEKNLFGPGAHYQWWRVLLQVCAAWGLIAAPVVGLVVGIQQEAWPLLLAAGSVISVHLAFSIIFVAEKQSDSLRLLLFPLGLLLINAMMVHAAYRCLKNNGIDWRGTHYPLAQLRAGQRIKF